MKILFFGASGSIGSKHFRLIEDNFPKFEVVCCDYKTEMTWKRAKRLIEFRPEVAFICGPTQYHIQAAVAVSANKLHTFIEKPLDVSLDYFGDLGAWVKKNELTTYVAYPFRHHTTIQRLKENPPETADAICLTDARKWPNYRRTKEEGGGALLELSHEIDYLQYIFGEVEKIQGTKGTSGKVCKAEEWANLILTHKGGKTTTAYLNIASPIEQRYIEVSGKQHNLKATDNLYLAQLRYFFDNIGNPDIANNIFEAKGLLEKILESRD